MRAVGLKRSPVAADLGLVFLLDRHDLIAHHGANGGDERANLVGDSDIHVSLPVPLMRRSSWRLNRRLRKSGP